MLRRPKRSNNEVVAPEEEEEEFLNIRKPSAIDRDLFYGAEISTSFLIINEQLSEFLDMSEH
jgi:hypothetical protein